MTAVVRGSSVCELRSATMGEETVVANALKAFRENLYQKAPNELVGEGHCLALVIYRSSRTATAQLSVNLDSELRRTDFRTEPSLDSRWPRAGLIYI
jgi:hypothetical protein